MAIGSLTLERWSQLILVEFSNIGNRKRRILPSRISPNQKEIRSKLRFVCIRTWGLVTQMCFFLTSSNVMFIFIIEVLVPFSIADIFSSICQQTSHHFGWQRPFSSAPVGKVWWPSLQNKPVPGCHWDTAALPSLCQGSLCECCVYKLQSHLYCFFFKPPPLALVSLTLMEN